MIQNLTELGRLIIVWLSMGFSFSFLLWTLRAEAMVMQSVEKGIGAFGWALLVGVIFSGVLLGLMRLFKLKWASIGLISYLTALFYMGFLKVAGWSFMPWVLIIGIIILGYFTLKKGVEFEVSSSLFLFHCMGTMSGLYMAFHLNEFLKGWVPFMDVLGGLWLLVSGGIARGF